MWTDLALWENHPAWRADPHGHLLAPVDAGSGPSGRGILVVHCPERLRSWLDRRGTVSESEAVTVAISILRGAGEADACGAERGSWWLTSAGRPLLALAEGAPWREETGALLADLGRGAGPALAHAVGLTRDIISDPRRLRRDAHAAEAALFAVTDPEPLITTPVITTPVGAHAAPAVRARAVPRVADAAAADHPVAAAIHAAVRRHVDGAWADRLMGAWRQHAPARPDRGAAGAEGTSRRRVVLAGVAVAAVVLVVGLWAPWEPVTPSSADAGDGASTAPRRSASRSPAPPSSAVRSATPHHPARATQTPAAKATASEAEAAALIDELASCASRGCPASLVEDTARELPPGVATREEGERNVTVIDDYGGVAVLRVAPAPPRADARMPDQIVVIVRTNDEWLVRDVYDVADQP